MFFSVASVHDQITVLLFFAATFSNPFSDTSMKILGALS